MVAFKLANFGGMIPAADDRLLPDGNASRAVDVWVYSGALEGIKQPRLIHTFTNPSARKAFRFPLTFLDKEHLSDSKWIEFEDADASIVKAPMSDDTHQRYYWAQRGQSPRYAPLATMLAGATFDANDGYLLGIPAPTTAPVVVPTGGVGATEVRAYVYTWVSAYGEEGPPSPPHLVTGKVDDNWEVDVTAPGSGDTTDRNLTRTRIYRTITSSAGVATYFLVTELAIADLDHTDSETSDVISGNAQLLSTGWIGPPDLEGIVEMPNGMLAGWYQNEIWFCEPYRPHAWPAQYQLSVANDIVGLGVIGQTLIVCTDGNPYACAGVNPSAMALSKISASEPCSSRGSIVSAPEGVYYASPNGLILAAQGVIQNVTRELMTKANWLDIVNASMLRATRLGLGYFAFSTVRAGCFEPTAFEIPAFEQSDFTDTTTGIYIDPTNPRVGMYLLSSDDNNFSIYSDVWTNEVFMVQDGAIYWLDMSSDQDMRPYLWRSKEFQASDKKNLSAVRVWFTVPDGTPEQNPVRNEDEVQTLAADQYGLVRVYADGRLVMTRELRTSGELFRIPSGFKAEFWQFEIEARVKIYNVQGASTVKELSSV